MSLALQQTVIDLYDQYTHHHIDRRTFLHKLSQLVGVAATANTLALLSNQAHAALIADNDPRLELKHINYQSLDQTIQGYLALPKDSPTALGAVIVIHENRGLNAHIKDVTRRLALAGFIAFAPDLLTPLGGTPEDEDAARQLISQLDKKQAIEQLHHVRLFLHNHPKSNQKVGAIGFCWGGGMVGEFAIASDKLQAGIVYYGKQPNSADVDKITSPLLLHYAGLDTRINEGIASFETALKKANKNYQLYIYEGVNHAFNNDTSTARYDKQAADLAWSRTIDFLQKQLA